MQSPKDSGLTKWRLLPACYAPEMKPVFARLRKDHESLSQIGSDFHAMIKNLGGGEVIERTTLIKSVEDFLNIQRNHMNFEKGQIFPHVKALVSEAVFDDIEQEYLASVDPLFGAKVENYFERIQQDIENHG